MSSNKSWSIFGLLLLSACASTAEVPEQIKRPNAARLLDLDKVRIGDTFERQMLAHFETPQKCEEPPPDGEAVRIDLLIYEGAQVSSVTLSKYDVLTTSSEITIEPGAEAIVLRLGSSRAHIWRINGAVHRIKKIFLASNSKESTGRPLAAVVGIPNSKVDVSSDPCLLDTERYYFLRQEQKAVGWKADALGNQIGMIRAYQTAGISLPSGTRYDFDLNRPRRFKGNENGVESAWADHLWHFPRGVYNFVPEEIDHINEARRYDLFPSKLGVIQLLKKGVLVRQADGDYRIIKALKTGIDIQPDNLILAEGVPKQDWFAKAKSCVVDYLGNRLSKTDICSWSKPSAANKNHLYSASKP